MVMVTDNAFISANPLSGTVHGTENIMYSFDPTTLMNISLSGDDVVLSWESETSELVLRNGKLTTSLRVAVDKPSFDAIPSGMDSVKIPYGVLVAGTKYLSIPFSFHDEKKDLMPVRFYSENGKLTMSADDQFSLAKITTDVSLEMEFDVKAPKYLLDCLYSKGDITDATPIQIGVSNVHTMFSNDIFQVYSAGIVKNTSDFDLIVSNFKAKTSCSFSPKSLATAMKPLVGMIPKKSDGTILTVSLSDTMTLGIKHKDVGEGSVDEVDNIEEIFNEDSQRTYKINMFPKAFEDYTKLFAVEKGHMSANDRMVYYKGCIESGGASLSLNYIFPVVMV